MTNEMIKLIEEYDRKAEAARKEYIDKISSQQQPKQDFRKAVKTYMKNGISVPLDESDFDEFVDAMIECVDLNIKEINVVGPLLLGQKPKNKDSKNKKPSNQTAPEDRREQLEDLLKIMGLDMAKFK